MTVMQCEEMVLPLSGLRVEWRPTDEHFRISPSDDAAEAIAGTQPWRTWLGHNAMAVGASGVLPRDPETTWWAVWGEYTGSDVQITLDDRTRPRVEVFGNLWISEGRGPEREATVETAGRRAEIKFAPAASLSQRRAGRFADSSTGTSSYIETPAAFHES
ncbi:hypothetical protein ACIP5Y_28465 [Nocardia sp. NPDC088792]|uniref:hypothetical protein n=1 Tax=Nocardia sp. NPDC088792 TaxID=3364332 RepID=UPI003824567E